jgi:catechol 2,3-dioxygenase-like lactoylglutathione lyase family enzyme
VNRIDHLVVGCADLDRGIAWVVERLGVAPVHGGSHDGFGTRNALLGLGAQYLEVLALDPGQPSMRGPLAEQVAAMDVPALINLAVARASLADAIAMSRVRPDGVRLEWELAFTTTPLFFIDWKDSEHPSVGLPDGGRITSVTVSTPEPRLLEGVEGVEVREGPWKVEAVINGVALA